MDEVMCIQYFNGHFASESGLASFLVDFPSPFIPGECILAQTLHILLDTASPSQCCVVQNI